MTRSWTRPAAASYRPLFDHFDPRILLGLTATPERMDGGNVAADFYNRFAAEIRLPEALEEKLLCPFHYFGVADPVDIREDFVNESEICLSFSVACHMIIL